MSTYPRLQSWLLWRSSEIFLPAVSMRFLSLPFLVVLACGLAVTPSAHAAHRRHHAVHKTSVKATKRTESSGTRAAKASAKSHRAIHRKVAVHRRVAVHHTTHHRTHRTTHRTAHVSRRSHTAVAARRAARPEAESKTLAETIPPIPMRDGHLYMPPPLVGSHASLVRQNVRGEAEGLKRIQNKTQLNAMRRDGKLVPLPVSQRLRVNPDLPSDRRCTRPWTAKFLTDLARAHYIRFDRPLQVNSAVRTVRFQRRLIRVTATPRRLRVTLPLRTLWERRSTLRRKGFRCQRSRGCARTCCPCRKTERSMWKRSSTNPASISRCTSRMCPEREGCAATRLRLCWLLG